jgi:hypothetical protein
MRLSIGTVRSEPDGKQAPDPIRPLSPGRLQTGRNGRIVPGRDAKAKARHNRRAFVLNGLSGCNRPGYQKPPFLTITLAPTLARL